MHEPKPFNLRARSNPPTIRPDMELAAGFPMKVAAYLALSAIELRHAGQYRSSIAAKSLCVLEIGSLFFLAQCPIVTWSNDNE